MGTTTIFFIRRAFEVSHDKEYDLHMSSKKMVGLLVGKLPEGCPGRRG
jgi:hypothetical protein